MSDRPHAQSSNRSIPLAWVGRLPTPWRTSCHVSFPKDTKRPRAESRPAANGHQCRSRRCSADRHLGMDEASRSSRRASAHPEGEDAMVTTVIGGAMLPHAPQFFTLPPTEDRANVDRVRTVAATIGGKLRELRPDLWIIFSNDHAEQFFHSVAPPFTVHVGGSADGHFAGHDFHWKIPSAIGFELVRQLYRQGFDPAFTSTAKIDYAMGIPLS